VARVSSGAHTQAGGPLGSFRIRLREEASNRWGVAPALAEALFLLPFVGAIAVVFARAYKPLFRVLTNEDSVLEWPQFVGFAAASLFAFACAWRFRKTGRPLLALVYLAFGLGCLFISGEEIAWGQRVLGYGTPEGLEEINEQKEVTVHNIDVVQQFTNGVYLLAGLYGSIGAWIVRWRKRPTELVDLLLPPLFLTGAFFVMFGYKSLRLLFFRESGFTVTRAGEWAELCLAFGFAAFAILVWRRLRAREQVPKARPAPASSDPGSRSS
jgi:hypothetical protein